MTAPKNASARPPPQPPGASSWELVPQQREAIDATFFATVASIPEGDAKNRGAALGEDVAVKIALGAPVT